MKTKQLLLILATASALVFSCKKDDENSDCSCNYCEYPGCPTEHREGRPRIPDKSELEQLAEDRNRNTNRQVGNDEILDNLIRRESKDRDEDEGDQDPRTDRASRRLRRRLSLRQQNRGSSVRQELFDPGIPAAGRCNYSSRVVLL